MVFCQLFCWVFVCLLWLGRPQFLELPHVVVVVGQVRRLMKRYKRPGYTRPSDGCDRDDIAVARQCTVMLYPYFTYRTRLLLY